MKQLFTTHNFSLKNRKVRMLLLLLSGFLSIAIFMDEVFAKGGGGGGGGDGIHFGLGLMTANQADVNKWIDSTATTGTKNISSGYEFHVGYEWRFSSSMFAVEVRPSYFTQSASGGGIEASLKGMTLFPMLRLYPLENSFMKFFMHFGLGYGSLSTKLANSATGGSGTFDGSAFGALGGLGAEFCFNANHCVSVEGNVRYLPIERNTGQGTGTLGGQITQSAGELELNGTDLSTTLSGIHGVLSYVLHF